MKKIPYEHIKNNKYLTDFPETKEAVIQNNIKHKPKENKKKDSTRNWLLPSK